jgi:hypothetical protein
MSPISRPQVFRECQPARAVETVSNLWKLFIALVEQCETAFDVSQVCRRSEIGVDFYNTIYTVLHNAALYIVSNQWFNSWLFLSQKQQT